MSKIVIEADTETGVCSVKVDGSEIVDVDSAGITKYKAYHENGYVDKVGYDVFTRKKENGVHTSMHVMASQVSNEMRKHLNG